MSSNPYHPIDCHFYDELEALATLGKEVWISYEDQRGKVSRCKSVFVDFYTQNKEEFAVLKSGLTLRLDRIKSYTPVRTVDYGYARSDEDLRQIHALQKANLPRNISDEELQAQGFVTVDHDFELLKYMNSPYPHAIAKSGNELVGYALVMLRELENRIPVLASMFHKINELEYKGSSLAESNYFIMGQVCVAKDFRGQGLFAQLYQTLKKQMSPHFEYMITEVATRNWRSMRAHEKVGFENILEFSDPTEQWAILLWDFK